MGPKTEKDLFPKVSRETSLLETTSAGTGLKINGKKTEPMKMKTTVNAPVTVGRELIREVQSSSTWEA